MLMWWPPGRENTYTLLVKVPLTRTATAEVTLEVPQKLRIKFCNFALNKNNWKSFLEATTFLEKLLQCQSHLFLMQGYVSLQSSTQFYSKSLQMKVLHNLVRCKAKY